MTASPAAALTARAQDVSSEIVTDILTLVRHETSSYDLPASRGGPGPPARAGRPPARPARPRTAPPRRRVRRHPHPDLHAAPRAGHVALVGHYDTVWPTGTLAGWEQPKATDDGGSKLGGPGIFDMKTGLAQGDLGPEAGPGARRARRPPSPSSSTATRRSAPCLPAGDRGGRAEGRRHAGAGADGRTARSRPPARAPGSSRSRPPASSRTPGSRRRTGRARSPRCPSSWSPPRPSPPPSGAPRSTPGSSAAARPSTSSPGRPPPASTSGSPARPNRPVSTPSWPPSRSATPAYASRSTTTGTGRPMTLNAASAPLLDLAREVAREQGRGDLPDAAVGGASDANFVAALGLPVLVRHGRRRRRRPRPGRVHLPRHRARPDGPGRRTPATTGLPVGCSGRPVTSRTGRAGSRRRAAGR